MNNLGNFMTIRVDKRLHKKILLHLKSAMYTVPYTRVANQGFLFRIPYPNLFHPGSRVKKIPDPPQRILVLLTLKTVCKLSEK